MSSVKQILVGIGLLFYIPLVRIAFYPTKLLILLGGVGQVQLRLRKPLIFSDDQAKVIRDDLAKDLKQGATRVLEYNDIETIPVSRHVYRRRGLEAVRNAESRLNSGEFLISTIVVAAGVFSSVVPLIPSSALSSVLGFKISSTWVLSLLSVTTAVIGLFILILVSLRSSVVHYLTYDDSELSVGVAPEELLMKMVWNEFVAHDPSKVLQMYYLLLFTKLLGEQPYTVTKSLIVTGMDPAVTRREALEIGLPKVVSAIREAQAGDSTSE